MTLRDFLLTLCVVALVGAFFQSTRSLEPPASPRLRVEVSGPTQSLEDLVIRASLTSDEPMHAYLTGAMPSSDISLSMGDNEWLFFPAESLSTEERDEHLRPFTLSMVPEPMSLGREFSWEVRPAQLYCSDRAALEQTFGEVPLRLKFSVRVGVEGTDSPLGVLSQTVDIPPIPALGERKAAKTPGSRKHSTTFRVKRMTKSVLEEHGSTDDDSAAIAGFVKRELDSTETGDGK